MKIVEFTLRDFKPLLHNNIRNIHVADISQITILVGPNGWGKSSILRELTPYAATRSDYGKQGLKVLHISHENMLYTLTSDFSKTNAHSFIRQDVELNVSGTTDVQNDLVATYFGYTKLLDSLLLGTYKITAMGRPARKELFMATYPGSLAFVLNHFNRLSTILRSTSSQLKLVKERQAVITDKLIASDTLKMYSDLKADLDKMIVQFDQNIFLCNKLQKNVYDSKSKLDAYSSYTLEYFTSNIEQLRQRLVKLKSNPTHTLTSGDTIQLDIAEITNVLKSLNSEYKSLMSRATDIKDDIDKYNNYLSTNIKDDIKRCDDIIAMQESILKERAVDPDIPLMTEDILNLTQTHLSDIEMNIQWLTSFGEHWTKAEHAAKQLEFAKVKMDLDRTESHLTDIINKITMLDIRLKDSNKDSYPDDCKRPCGLKSRVQHITTSLMQERETYIQDQDKTYASITDLRNRYDELKNSLEGRATAEAKLEILETIMCRIPYGIFVCNNMSFISALNSNPHDMWNKLLRVIKNTSNHFVCKQARELIDITKAKRDNLKSSDIPARAMITATLVKKELELKQIHIALDNISSRGKLMQSKRDGYVTQASILKELTALKTTFSTWVDYKKLEADEQLLEDTILDLATNKTSVYEKLRSIETILLEQQGYITILNDELVPTISSLEAKIKKLSIITEQLSPTAGIPYKYTVQYINDLFKLANTFIKHIWEHELELVYFKDKDDLDFIFKLLINNSSELKDINMCSKGQRSLIDLVINLSICIYRGYSQIYPIKLDEIDDGMTPAHQARLTEFLGDLLQQNTINQVFLMNHHVSVSTSFRDAGVISLCSDDIIPTNCKVISKIN